MGRGLGVFLGVLLWFLWCCGLRVGFLCCFLLYCYIVVLLGFIGVFVVFWGRFSCCFWCCLVL